MLFSTVFILALIYTNNAITLQQLEERISKIDLTNTNELTSLGKESIQPYRDSLKTLISEMMTYNYEPTPKHEILTCDVCKFGVPLIRLLFAFGIPPPIMISAAVALCKALDLAPAPAICEPMIVSYADPIFYILKARPDLTMMDVCGLINPGCTEVNANLTDWPTNINPNKPPSTPIPQIPINLEQTKIIQLTDIHLDLDYTVGTSGICSYPICCRENFTSKATPINDDNIAGVYGHFHCALPEKTFHSLLNHIRNAHRDVKYIYLTGDYIHHGIWLYGVEENTKHIIAVTEAIKEYFPNTKVYPLSGNHEPDMVNLYPPTSISDDYNLDWMYDLIMAPFAEYIPEDQIALFKRGGYYTVSPEPGFRLVIINSNLCYVNNLWLAFDSIDPEGQLQWLADTLLSAEAAGEIVHILGHITPGDYQCWPVWSDKYDKIINRFEAIIKAQFYGHSHLDYFTIAFETGTERPISTSYVSPSGTPSRMHPGYKVFFADGERGEESTWEIQNFETWVLNITLSNALDLPVVQKVYDARNDYGLTSFRPKDLYDLVYRMIEDDEVFQRFLRNRNKGDSPRFIPCHDDLCKTGYLCNLVTSNSGDNSHCQRISEAIINARTRRDRLFN